MYKRPIIRPRRVPLQFVKEIRADGSTAGYWVAVSQTQVAPSGTPGRVGEIIDRMRLGASSVRTPAKRPWTPPRDYEFIAKFMKPEEREDYLARCKAWVDAHPPPPLPEPKPPLQVNNELVVALFNKWSPSVPPIAERVKVYRAAGYPESVIENAIARDKMLEETADARQEVIDKLFAKWPSAGKSTPKPKKVIKAVKKRMGP